MWLVVVAHKTIGTAYNLKDIVSTIGTAYNLKDIVSAAVQRLAKLRQFSLISTIAVHVHDAVTD